MRSMRKTVCYNCTPETGRRPGCHDICEEYIAWRKKMDKARKKEQEYKDYIRDMYYASARMQGNNKKPTKAERVRSSYSVL